MTKSTRFGRRAVTIRSGRNPSAGSMRSLLAASWKLTFTKFAITNSDGSSFKICSPSQVTLPCIGSIISLCVFRKGPPIASARSDDCLCPLHPVGPYRPCMLTALFFTIQKSPWPKRPRMGTRSSCSAMLLSKGLTCGSPQITQVPLFLDGKRMLVSRRKVEPQQRRSAKKKQNFTVEPSSRFKSSRARVAPMGPWTPPRSMTSLPLT
mmetsp:Transcript_33126/g.98596  ORF Transcript_33126/g.98596 Transcript_33126/m.98596 type:complete len:208 (-) Transcript_33126:167-790(-)